MNASYIAAELRRRIESGECERGTRLPSVTTTGKEFGVSGQTAAAAYAVLAALGLVRIEKGNGGTIVTAGRKSDAHLGTYAPPDLTAAVAWKPTEAGGEATEETYQVLQREAPDYMAEWGVPAGTVVVERHRIRKVDGVPVQHKLTVLPYDVAARVPEGFEGIPPMLAPVGAEPQKPPHGVRFADWMGWGVVHTECVITTESMTTEASEALGVPAGTPGFRVVGVARNADGGTVNVTVTTCGLHHRVTLNIVG
ncbi:GntR family transcriptional regulator (plasmid) [Streptomyces sp. NBC_01310]|uniref:GntR family transcriptional regulator n=1 Tax=Streptomyces sp. NBC_01310 TaxID=2903820 RepID=UPI0035B5BBC9|nr:GntR family transcriptional regulator [Streptomyces sp. NBC_01310]